MSVFSKLDTYIQSDKIFEKMNALKNKTSSKAKREYEILERVQKFENDMKKKLFENNKLNQTKLLAIKQHVENNKQRLMKKLEFLQSSIEKEEKEGRRKKIGSEFSMNDEEETLKDFMERMKSKIDGKFEK